MFNLNIMEHLVLCGSICGSIILSDKILQCRVWILRASLHGDGTPAAPRGPRSGDLTSFLL